MQGSGGLADALRLVTRRGDTLEALALLRLAVLGEDVRRHGTLARVVGPVLGRLELRDLGDLGEVSLGLVGEVLGDVLRHLPTRTAVARTPAGLSAGADRARRLAGGELEGRDHD